ncbi:MAG TPA: site-2 protease family protein [Thermoguttaceae bacterium]
MLYIIFLCVVVAIALGLVIFVHELGHFIVAKLCGVKCEKFYLGFDIGGLKLCKFRWGETEYGIGILPLGGYVKMLGQEDNPARLKEEIERAKMHQAAAGEPGAATSSGINGERSGEQFNVAEAEKALYDPRSFLAKSVPQRAAIFAAGVIMNVIFAFLAAIVAYYIGVEQAVCGVGEVFPGEAAWRAGLRVGDRIIEIAGKKAVRYQDLKKNITVGDIDNGVQMLVRRPGINEPLKFLVHPDLTRGFPMIGVINPRIATLTKEAPPAWPGTAAAESKPSLQKGDRIVMIDGVKIENYWQLYAYLAEHTDRPLKLMVECTVPAEGRKREAVETTRLVEVTVPPEPMRRLGLVMTMGAIVAIQENSPAAVAGIEVHDKIVKIDGNPVGDPMTLPDRLRKLSGETIILSVDREGSSVLIDIPVTLRQVDWYEQPQIENNPLSVPELGIAYKVLNRVDQVIAGSPAEKAGIKPGEMIQQATIIPPDASRAHEAILQKKMKIDFNENNANWPFFFYALQRSYPGSRVELALSDNKKALLEAEEVSDWFNPDRGFIFDAEVLPKKAETIGQAVRWGADETWESLTLVVRVLRKLGSQISVKELAGPFSIAVMAGQAAKQGTATLLLFLTLLSANLAVLNLLPIPLLDGGHLIFLGYEAIRGKPADERVQIGLSVMGFVFLLGLMLFVIGNDFFRLVFFLFK